MIEQLISRVFYARDLAQAALGERAVTRYEANVAQQA